MLNVILNSIQAADSSRSVALMKDTNHVSSLFENHLLIVKNGDTKLHIVNHYYLLSFILFVSFLLFVWLYAYNSNRIKNVIKGFYVNRFANQLAREGSYFASKSTYLLAVIFIFSSSLFVLQVLQFYKINLFPTDYALIYISLIICGTYIAKFLSILSSGRIFKMPNQVREYIISIFLFCNSLGLFLLPVVICLIFVRQFPSQIFIYIGFIFIAVFYFTRILRGLLIGLRIVKASKFYLFLYLCTLEILPLVIIVKLFLLNSK